MSGVRDSLGRLPLRRHGILGAIIALSVLVAVSSPRRPGAAERGAQTAKQTRALWTGVAGTPRPARTGARAGDPARSLPFVQAGPRRPAERARQGGERARRLSAGAGRRLPALRARALAGDGAGARAQAPEIKTFAGRGLDDPTATIRRRHRPARVPRLGALAEGLVVHRPVLPQRPERVRQLLRPGPRQRARRLRRARGRRGRSRGVRGELAERSTSPKARSSRCAPTGSRCSATRRTRPTSAARQRDGRQGHARQPRQPDLRGRDGGPHDPRSATTT